MKLTAKRKEQISSVLIICLGNILNAFSARVFLLPADLVAGGTTGIGLIPQRITGILCTLFVGIGIGISLGMIIRTGASTGGVDVPPLILNKYFRFPGTGSSGPRI